MKEAENNKKPSGQTQEATENVEHDMELVCENNGSEALSETAEAEGDETVIQKDAQEGDSYLALAQRIQADFDNYRRRNESMRRDALLQGSCDTIKAFLPVLDNLDRAVQSAEKTEDVQALREGIGMIQRQFYDVLDKLDVHEIPALGEEFDPNIHNAVMRDQPGDGFESGQVSEVVQKGYRTGHQILRYAMVKVVE